MCIKLVNVCCYCSELMEPHWVSCNLYLLLCRAALSHDPPLEEPVHGRCPYEKKGMRPMLRGCANDSCPSWIWCISEGLGEAESNSQEVIDAEEEQLAKARYEDYKIVFAENHCMRRPILIRKNFGNFLETALDDIPAMDLDDSFDDEISLTDDDEDLECMWAIESPGSLSVPIRSSSAPPNLCVQFDFNPELPSQENATAKEDNTNPESESPSVENLVQECLDIVAYVRTWFFPDESNSDTEVS